MRRWDGLSGLPMYHGHRLAYVLLQAFCIRCSTWTDMPTEPNVPLEGQHDVSVPSAAPNHLFCQCMLHSAVTGTRDAWRIKAEPFPSPLLTNIVFSDSLLHISTTLSDLDYDNVHQNHLRYLFRRSRSRCSYPSSSAPSLISRKYVLLGSTVRNNA